MTEPRITVTANDRQAVCDAHGVPHADYNWVATGERGLVSWNRQAYAIARARTMAAFEERVRSASLAFWQGCDAHVMFQVCNERGEFEPTLSECESLCMWRDSTPTPSDANCRLTNERIRAVVLAGWEGTT